MCLHMFTYYPRMNDFYLCGTMNHPLSWQKIMKTSTYIFYFIEYLSFIYFLRIPTFDQVKQWLLNLTWTPQLATQWQEFYNTASRLLLYGSAGQMENEMIPTLPTYKDLQPDICPK